jgi:UDP-N-acetylglucosamine 2-epimerase (non-hydrolysing)
MHPRTRKELTNFGLFAQISANKNIMIVDPLGYIEIISLVKDALCLVTDSGGIQDESTYLSVPCLTIRRTTERPITTTIGSSTLIGEDMQKLLRLFRRVCNNTYKKYRVPKYWDGKASERIVRILASLFTS